MRGLKLMTSDPSVAQSVQWATSRELSELAERVAHLEVEGAELRELLQMEIWVDADACPVVIKETLFRAAKRTGVRLTLVANQPMQVPKSPSIRMVQVASGFDVADNEIVRRCNAGDLVITSDIPLAAEVIGKGGHALSPRGEMYSPDDIKARLTMRDFMDTLRASGIHTGGPPVLSQSERQQFARHLDTLLAKQLQ